MRRRPRTATPVALVCLALGLAFASCSDSGGGPDTTLDVETLSATGPHPVGEAQLTLIDGSRPTQAVGSFPGAAERTLQTRIWYPATSAGSGAAPSGDGPFPIVGWAHGITSGSAEGQFVGAHLASHGYVVVAPSFPLSHGGAPGGATIADTTSQPGDLDFVMRRVAAGAAGDALASAIDDTRRGVAGFSLGGGTVLLAAYHPTWRIENLAAAVAVAPASCFFGEGVYDGSLPVLIVAGDADMLVPLAGGPERAFRWADAPIDLVTLRGATHFGFIGVDGTDGRSADALVGCASIGTGGSGAAAGIGPLARLLEVGVGPSAFDPTPCPESCTDEYPATMASRRQLQLVRATALAHLDAVLRGDREKTRWLEQGLAAQAGDVVVSLRR
jgi:dienelactone hydrolase